MLVQDIEFESKKLTDIDKFIRDKSMRFSTIGGAQTENTMNQGTEYHENNIFDNSRRDEGRLPRITEEEIDLSYVPVQRYSEK